MSTVLIGIDPGLSGACAVMDTYGKLVDVWDLPVIRDGKAAWIDAALFHGELLSQTAGAERHVWIERVHAMPKQGVSSSFNFGVVFGSLLGALRLMQCPINFVQPAKWKRDLGLSGDKNASLDKARLLYPQCDKLMRKKDEGRAEAILIAHWARGRWANPTAKGEAA